VKFFCALTFFALNSAYAWGPIGHRVVGEIAQKRLKPEVAKKVEQILEGQNLADVSNWADLIRSDPAWKKASPWHYVNIEDKKKYKDTPPDKEGDVIWAVEHFSETLNNKQSSAQERKVALSFLVHFVGDLHQPLHVSRKADLGGNTIALRWFGKKTNLHEVWDEKIIELEQLSFTEYAAFIERSVGANESWEKDPLLTWIEESLALRPLVYDFPQKPTRYWEYEYRFKTHKVLYKRLIQAGIRLAALLNRILL
jgi:hypothetical protein